MSGLAGYLLWHDAHDDETIIHEMLKLIPHRSIDGQSVYCKDNIAFGHGLLASKDSERYQRHIACNIDKTIIVVADAEVFNRQALFDRLVTTDHSLDELSNAELLLALYDRFGLEMVDWVYGDYAFVVWDAHLQQLLAVRDPFGARPFFFASTHDFFAFGSEPKQLLILDDVSPQVNPSVVGEYLFDNMQEIRETFYEDVRRLRPACYLRVTSTGFEEVRYWNPKPREDMKSWTREQYYAGFREHLLRAVERRLDTDYAVGMELSGGFDSTSLVMMAHNLKVQDFDLPRIATISRVYGDFSTDESEYIASTRERITFDHFEFDPTKQDVITNEILFKDVVELNSPFSDLQRSAFEHSSRVVNEIEGRTLITGVGGDEVTHIDFHFDLARSRKFVRLIDESWFLGKTTYAGFHWFMFDAFKFAAPEWIKKVYRSIRRRRKKSSIPDWVTPEFREYFLSCPYPDFLLVPDYEFHFQREIVRYVSTYLVWIVESIEVQSAYRGFYAKHPFLDRELIEYVISIPLDGFLPAHHWRALNYHGLASDLPPLVRERRGKAGFGVVTAHILKNSKDELRTLLKSGPWLSERYVSKATFEAMLEDLTGNESDWRLVSPIWRIITIEVWLRSSQVQLE